MRSIEGDIKGIYEKGVKEKKFKGDKEIEQTISSMKIRKI
jgi:hypothetical protein